MYDETRRIESRLLHIQAPKTPTYRKHNEAKSMRNREGAFTPMHNFDEKELEQYEG